jgi:hypothetical protein
MPGNSAYLGPRKRLFAVVAGISIAISALLCLDLIDYRHQAVDKARAVSDNMSRLLSERFDGSVREVDFVLRDILDDVSLGTRGSRLETIIATKRRTLSQASSITVLDPWGRSLAASPTAANLDAERACLGAFVADGKLDALTQAVFGKGINRSTLIRARAVRDPDGSLAAVVSARIDVSVIQSELADLELGEHRIIAVTDPELKLVARRPEMPDAIGVEVVDAGMRSLLRDLREAGPGPNAMRSETGSYYY